MSGGPLDWRIEIASVPAQGIDLRFVADESARAALAGLNEVESVDSFEARFDVRPAGRDRVAVVGRLDAVATRICVVTLEPFPETVSEEIDLRFSTEAPLPHGGEEGPDDPPEPVVDGVIDLGAVAAEFFTLALDPHPRRPGAVFASRAEEDREASPFEALRKLRVRGEGSD